MKTYGEGHTAAYIRGHADGRETERAAILALVEDVRVEWPPSWAHREVLDDLAARIKERG